MFLANQHRLYKLSKHICANIHVAFCVSTSFEEKLSKFAKQNYIVVGIRLTESKFLRKLFFKETNVKLMPC